MKTAQVVIPIPERDLGRDDSALCEKCYKEARFEVIEVNGVIWFYCGECKVAD